MTKLFEWLVALGPVGTLMVSALDSAGIPMVGGVDALLIVVAVTSPSAAYLSAALAVAGSVAGSLVLFMIARKGGEAYLDKHTVSRRGLGLKSWFLEYGLLTVFVPAVVPIVPMPMKIFVLSAGALGVSPWVFSLVLGVARVIRYFIIAWMSLRLGSGTLPYLRQHLWQLVALAIGLFGFLYVVISVVDRRRKLRRAVQDETT
ncbi:MAG: VTT domain-containing protein [Acidobacteriaceae bacterium]|nr:VTT domain-containing protein [Acidobacteriaceae bacterium]